ncbi:uncharacterized protein LOC127284656 [Leptopilina boulardi]|uniref:uncharacterized protein LOC127284656 n=1 Tax=Leptopilina boulardi TaxID=63433 RepID=UPI0021F51EED|nr:uncharacterized protein LOC127284656 [Leptopilina boulardi]
MFINKFTRISSHLFVIALFLIKESRSEDCNLNRSLSIGEYMNIHNPNYPGWDSGKFKCIYSANTNEDNRLQLKCKLGLPTSQLCDSQTFAVFKNPSSLLNIPSFFYGNGTFRRKSIKNEITIVYEGSENSSSGYFRCNITAVAASTLPEKSVYRFP